MRLFSKPQLIGLFAVLIWWVGGIRVSPAQAWDLSFVLEPSEVHYSLAQTTQEVLAPLHLYSEDKFHLFPPPELGLGCKILVWRAPVYRVIDGNREFEVRSWKKKIGEILAEKKIEVGEKDRVSPGLTAEVAPGETIRIVRVSETEIVETEAIPYQVRQQEDSQLERGKTRVVQAGRTGLRQLTYLVRRENGREVSRKLLKTEVVRPPQDKIVAFGTKVVVLSSQTGIISWTNGVTASRRYRKGTKLRVTNLANGRWVEVTVGGWGPYEYTGYILDLERSAFSQIADLAQGTFYGRVEELGS